MPVRRPRVRARDLEKEPLMSNPSPFRRALVGTLSSSGLALALGLTLAGCAGGQAEGPPAASPPPAAAAAAPAAAGATQASWEETETALKAALDGAHRPAPQKA